MEKPLAIKELRRVRKELKDTVSHLPTRDLLVRIVDMAIDSRRKS